MRFPFFITGAIVGVTCLFASGLGFQMLGESTYFTSYLANLAFHHNFHEVIPARLYRSSEMSRDELTALVRQHGIASVIDLRIDDDYVDESGKTEAQAVAEAGADYRHVPFSSRRADQRESVLKLLSAYQEMRPPFLVHCSSGTHRSGVASAIWLITKEGRSAAEASDQLSMRYGYFQWERDLKALLQGKPTLDRIISKYEEDSSRDGMSFEQWAREAPLLEPKNKSKTKDD